MENLRIDGQRLWDSLMEMARVGATDKGGVCRLALTDLDKQSRDLFTRWCEQAGCRISVDAAGNIFARRPGRNDRDADSQHERTPLVADRHDGRGTRMHWKRWRITSQSCSDCPCSGFQRPVEFNRRS